MGERERESQPRRKGGRSLVLSLLSSPYIHTHLTRLSLSHSLARHAHHRAHLTVFIHCAHRPPPVYDHHHRSGLLGGDSRLLAERQILRLIRAGNSKSEQHRVDSTRRPFDLEEEPPIKSTELGEATDPIHHTDLQGGVRLVCSPLASSGIPSTRLLARNITYRRRSTP